MTTKEIKNFRSRIERLIDTRRLRDAIKELKDTARRRMAWEVSDGLEQVERSYAYMLRYVAEGVEDPERPSVYNSIVNDIYKSLDALVHYLEKIENPSQYYSIVRLFDQHPQTDRIPQLVRAYADAASKMSIFSLLSGVDNGDEAANRKQMEQLQQDLFVSVWVKAPLSAIDADTLQQALGSDEFSREFKTHLISAITLGLMQRFDTRRIELLMGAYMTGTDIKVTSAALVGFLLGLWMYKDRPLPVKVAARLETLKEMSTWSSDLRTAFIEMIRARDTERINRKIQNEIVPDMMKMRPEIMNKVNNGEIDPNDMASMQENPEWQELLDKNGITGKLKELTEMQMEGGDVMMGTFAHLKNFAFFNDISNWFLPYTSSHSAVAAAQKDMGVMAEMVENAMYLCDNDKYSFVFALNMVPPSQRQLMVSQLQAQSDQLYEAMSNKANTTDPEARRKAVNQYMQNIYRFFKLYRRRDEFFDPFKSGINLISVPALAADFDDQQLLRVVAEFYFKLGYWRESLSVYEHMAEEATPDALQYQKMGYCCEKLGEYKDAIRYYQRAELLDTTSVWVVRRLAACFRAMGDKDMALKYHKHLVQLVPTDLNAALLLGYAQLERGDYDDAVKQFYMVEFLDEKSTKSWRPLAWTLFLTGDLEASRRYYERIATDKPTANDYLNMGHVELASGDMRSAVNYYKLCVENLGNEQEKFLGLLYDDMPALRRAGVEPTLIPLVADAVLYALR